MAVTILETLQNANYNLTNNGFTGARIAQGQLHNAVTLLDKGYDVDELVEPFLEKYGAIENVPPIEDIEA